MTDGEAGWAKGQEGVVYDTLPDASLVREPVRRFEDLRVWQSGMDLAESVYRLTASFPSDERFGMTSQLRRCAASVPANIAEGWGRASRKDYTRLLRIARGSLYETKTHLLLSQRVLDIDGAETAEVIQQIEPLRRQLQALITALGK